MKRFILGAIVLTSIVETSQSIIVKLPDATTFEKCFQSQGYHHFIKTTFIDKKLGKKEIEAREVATEVEKALHDYYLNHLKKPLNVEIAHIHKQRIIQTLLQDSPEAIKELKERGLL